MGLSEKAIESGVDAALKAREEMDKRRKITDEATLRLRVCASCRVGETDFFPPLDVYVNGVRKAVGINAEGSGTSPNELDFWHTVGVDSDGVRPVQIKLIPVDTAADWFRAGTSRKERLEPAFLRNEIEKRGGDFYDPELRAEATPAHRIRIEIRPRRIWFLGPRRSERELLERFQVGN